MCIDAMKTKQNESRKESLHITQLFYVIVYCSVCQHYHKEIKNNKTK